MALSIGIVGLPNVGKSTLFNALVKRQLAKVAEYPFTTIEPHEGAIDVPDSRLVDLTMTVKPDKSTPASITFIDIAGLVKGAHKGEGLGNEFLSHIRETDAILEVLRAFESETAQHTLGTVEPERDRQIVNTELVLKDMDYVSKLIDKSKDNEEKDLLQRIKNALDKETPVRDMVFSCEEEILVKTYNFLTSKPVFYVVNLSEHELNDKNIREIEDKDYLVVSAKMEADLIDLTPLEQKEYLESYKLETSLLEKVIQKSYQVLNLVTFYTIKGGREVRAWPIKNGTNAHLAAEKVHTDMAKGFIKAEVINVKDLLIIGDWHKAHIDGKMRFEGKDYLVKDADVIEFKFKI
ncbi:redox-regulated ATPase YchF [Candidatus Gottesmanbacteria bacterium RBG_13_37_7]|uniref:Redox-regulated ATPase YchF n=1 Tax=Candidatus Gottesmanbacteria bacterium RBG_13_37_7 TaxID=1798369 RepID=A0A1F5YK10_9BACT|nr:MAG: redox-regulated ATPase YchF [Candidatus Gottesmanbacteria bacterium RBG_13_37_7]